MRYLGIVEGGEQKHERECAVINFSVDVVLLGFYGGVKRLFLNSLSLSPRV
jgi:hypothetical protein